jgi:LPXTG-motif cell wall-anchored protein
VQRITARTRILAPAAGLVFGVVAALPAWSAVDVAAQTPPPPGPPDRPGPPPNPPQGVRPGPPAGPPAGPPPARSMPFPGPAQLPRTGGFVAPVGAALVALAGAAGGVVLRRRRRARDSSST